MRDFKNTSTVVCSNSAPTSRPHPGLLRATATKGLQGTLKESRARRKSRKNLVQGSIFKLLDDDDDDNDGYQVDEQGFPILKQNKTTTALLSKQDNDKRILEAKDTFFDIPSSSSSSSLFKQDLEKRAAKKSKKAKTFKELQKQQQREEVSRRIRHDIKLQNKSTSSPDRTGKKKKRPKQTATVESRKRAEAAVIRKEAATTPSSAAITPPSATPLPPPTSTFDLMSPNPKYKKKSRTTASTTSNIMNTTTPSMITAMERQKQNDILKRQKLQEQQESVKSVYKKMALQRQRAQAARARLDSSLHGNSNSSTTTHGNSSTTTTITNANTLFPNKKRKEAMATTTTTTKHPSSSSLSPRRTTKKQASTSIFASSFYPPPPAFAQHQDTLNRMPAAKRAELQRQKEQRRKEIRENLAGVSFRLQEAEKLRKEQQQQQQQQPSFDTTKKKESRLAKLRRQQKEMEEKEEQERLRLLRGVVDVKVQDKTPRNTTTNDHHPSNSTTTTTTTTTTVKERKESRVAMLRRKQQELEEEHNRLLLLQQQQQQQEKEKHEEQQIDEKRPVATSTISSSSAPPTFATVANNYNNNNNTKERPPTMPVRHRSLQDVQEHFARTSFHDDDDDNVDKGDKDEKGDDKNNAAVNTTPDQKKTPTTTTTATPSTTTTATTVQEQREDIRRAAREELAGISFHLERKAQAEEEEEENIQKAPPKDKQPEQQQQQPVSKATKKTRKQRDSIKRLQKQLAHDKKKLAAKTAAISSKEGENFPKRNKKNTVDRQLQEKDKEETTTATSTTTMLQKETSDSSRSSSSSSNKSRRSSASSSVAKALKTLSVPDKEEDDHDNEMVATPPTTEPEKASTKSTTLVEKSPESLLTSDKQKDDDDEMPPTLAESETATTDLSMPDQEADVDDEMVDTTRESEKATTKMISSKSHSAPDNEHDDDGKNSSPEIDSDSVAMGDDNIVEETQSTDPARDENDSMQDAVVEESSSIEQAASSSQDEIGDNNSLIDDGSESIQLIPLNDEVDYSKETVTTAPPEAQRTQNSHGRPPRPGPSIPRARGIDFFMQRDKKKQLGKNISSNNNNNASYNLSNMAVTDLSVVLGDASTIHEDPTVPTIHERDSDKDEDADSVQVVEENDSKAQASPVKPTDDSQMEDSRVDDSMEISTPHAEMAVETPSPRKRRSTLTPKTDLNGFLSHLAVLNDLKDLLASPEPETENDKTGATNIKSSPGRTKFQQMFQIKCNLLKYLDTLHEEDSKERKKLMQQYDLEAEDIDFIQEHIQLCQEENSDIRWDLIETIIFPEAAVDASTFQDGFDTSLHNRSVGGYDGGGSLHSRSLTNEGSYRATSVASYPTNDASKLGTTTNTPSPPNTAGYVGGASFDSSYDLGLAMSNSMDTDFDMTAMDEEVDSITRREEYQEVILELFEATEETMEDLTPDEIQERRQVLVQLLQATSEEEHHLSSLALEDVSEIVEHVIICEDTNTLVQWDMIRDIVFPLGMDDASGHNTQPSSPTTMTFPQQEQQQQAQYPYKTDQEELDSVDSLVGDESFRNLFEISQAELDVVLSHINICKQTEEPIRWDLVGEILFPGDPVRQLMLSNNSADLDMLATSLHNKNGDNSSHDAAADPATQKPPPSATRGGEPKLQLRLSGGLSALQGAAPKQERERAILSLSSHDKLVISQHSVVSDDDDDDADGNASETEYYYDEISYTEHSFGEVEYTERSYDDDDMLVA